MRVLVTGSAGFIGKHTVKALCEHGYDVLSVDKDIDDNVYAQSLICDIIDPKLEAIIADYQPDAIIHLAAQSSVEISTKDWKADADSNIMGTINVVKLCQKYGVKRIVFSSSGGTVYGDAQAFPTLESHPLNPASPYGVSKVAGEFYVKISGISHAVLRYPNVYGPGQPGDKKSGVVAIFVERMLQSKPCEIFGDGMKTRDYVYIDDVVKANLLALESKADGVFNIGNEVEITTNGVWKTISDLLSNKIMPEFKPERKGEVQKSCLDSSKAHRLLNWYPDTHFISGIEYTIAAQRGQEDKSPVSYAGGEGSIPSSATKEVQSAISES